MQLAKLESLDGGYLCQTCLIKECPYWGRYCTDCAVYCPDAVKTFDDQAKTVLPNYQYQHRKHIQQTRINLGVKYNGRDYTQRQSASRTARRTHY